MLRRGSVWRWSWCHVDDNAIGGPLIWPSLKTWKEICSGNLGSVHTRPPVCSRNGWNLRLLMFLRLLEGKRRGEELRRGEERRLGECGVWLSAH